MGLLLRLNVTQGLVKVFRLSGKRCPIFNFLIGGVMFFNCKLRIYIILDKIFKYLLKCIFGFIKYTCKVFYASLIGFLAICLVVYGYIEVYELREVINNMFEAINKLLDDIDELIQFFNEG